MNADDEHQKARLEQELESTFLWVRHDRIKLPAFPIISGHQRSSAVLFELSRLRASSIENPNCGEKTD
jgi:hypothetical protein